MLFETIYQPEITLQPLTTKLTNSSLINADLLTNQQSIEVFEVDQETKDYFKKVVYEIELYFSAKEVIEDYGDALTTIPDTIKVGQKILEQIADRYVIFNEVITELKSTMSTPEILKISEHQIQHVGEFHFCSEVITHS